MKKQLLFEQKPIKLAKPDEISVGDSAKLVAEFCEGFLPYGKALVLSFFKEFATYGKAIRERLLEKNIRLETVVLPDNFSFSVMDLCGVFCAGEEIRGVIALGSRAFSVAKYFSTVRNLPCFLVTYDGEMDCAFLNQIAIKNRESFDIVATNSQGYLIVDDQALKSSNFVRNCAIELCRKLILAFDLFFAREEYKSLYKKVISALSYCAFLTFENEESNKKLLDLLSSVEEAFYKIENKRVLSSLDVSEFLLEKNQRLNIGVLTLCHHILSLYLNGCKTDTLDLPDYRARVEKLCLVYNIEQNVLLKNLLFQADRVRNFADEHCKRIDGAIGDLIYAIRLVEIILDKYKIPIERLTDEQKEIVGLSGDTNLSFNGMSVLRELGRK
jgi:hypothetical protein